MSDRVSEPRIAVYLFPAALGGGRGDIEEVLCAGRVLARLGANVFLFRGAGRPLPGGVDSSFAWPSHRRVRSVGPVGRFAVTVTSAWGVTAAPGRDGPLGKPGPWSAESAQVEAAYGPDRTVHVSLEEFARTLSSREQSIERYREGGWAARRIRRRTATAEFRREVRRFHDLYRRFRDFDRANLLHLFPGLEARPAFDREYPEAVQTGPLWGPISERSRQRARGRGPRSIGRREWVWYASPVLSKHLGPAVLAGLAESPDPPRLFLRGAVRGLAAIPRTVRVESAGSMSPFRWRRRFDRAELRIVGGSRSLLEAVALGGPFLYFNGVLGKGNAARRHRPEKIIQLLPVLRRSGMASSIVADLARFSRGQQVLQVVRRAASSPRWRAGFGRPVTPVGYLPPFDSANALLAELMGRLRVEEGPSAEIVQSLRASAHRGPSATRARSKA